MSETKKVKLRDAILIAGVHQEAGTVVDVELALALRLVGSGRAEPVDQVKPNGVEGAIPPGAEGKQNNAKGGGLTTGNAGGLLRRG